jgi:hypothetical protein
VSGWFFVTHNRASSFFTLLKYGSWGLFEINDPIGEYPLSCQIRQGSDSMKKV